MGILFNGPYPAELGTSSLKSNTTLYFDFKELRYGVEETNSQN
jgi:hypothetical protein